MPQIATVLRALADETRLQMMALVLRYGELCVCDFVQVLQITQSKASRHLRYLAHAGLLKDRREAVWIHYRLADDLPRGYQRILRSVAELLPAHKSTDLARRFVLWQKEKCRRTRTCLQSGRKRKRSALP